MCSGIASHCSTQLVKLISGLNDAHSDISTVHIGIRKIHIEKFLLRHDKSREDTQFDFVFGNFLAINIGE